MSLEAYDYGKKDGIAEEQERILEILEKLRQRYYESKPTSLIALHPFDVAMKEIKEFKNE